MKKVYLTIGVLILMRFLLPAQTSTAIHSRGAVYCSGKDAGQTTLYIGGHLQAWGDGSSVCAISVEGGRVKLTGDLLNDVPRGSSGGTVFVSPSSANYGLVEFCGVAPQQITTSGTNHTNIPSKLHNFINFPHVYINNSKHVILDSRLAGKTRDIVLEKGWLVVDSKLAEANVDGGVEVDAVQESVLAHLLVDGDIDYKESSWTSKPDANQRGFIQVNLKLANEGGLAQKSIVGFGIPFKEMRNDYFMFNTLLEPQVDGTGAGFLGKAPLTDPTTRMAAGKGYVAGIDLRGNNASDYPELDGYQGVIDFSQRAQDGYQFNRHSFASDNNRNKNQVNGSDLTSDAYVKEVLNTKDVIVGLKQGYNYLANPYTCPLNIDKLLDENNAQSTWNIHSAEWADGIDMWNRVWVLAPNSMAEASASGDITKSKYTYNYQVAMKTGGTYIDNDNVSGVTALAPLQMFVIYSRKDMNITIPKAERVMGTTRFLRNSPLENKRRDDFIIEFRDINTRTTDRASIVLRTQQEIAEGNYTNVERLKSSSGESANNTRSTMAADFSQSHASQIYTKNEAGKPLTVQFLPVETTQRIVLYHIPSSKGQALNILGRRLDTKDKIRAMWLEDSKYNTEVEITPDMLYQTYSEPTDSYERFTIRFSTEITSIEDEHITGSNVYAYSENGSIYAQGFEAEDMGSSVELYNINGVLMASVIADKPKMLLKEDCPAGVYIVKANTQKAKTMKLLVR